MDLHKCEICPRCCGADRYKNEGYCGCGARIKAARAYLHMWEEPCLSGTKGSGTVFFSGCNLRCRFCQNYKISQENFGTEMSEKRLAEVFLSLQEKGAHNINLVSPTPYVPLIVSALDLCGNNLKIPIIYNTGGYERTETLKALEGYVDVYLPDFKYYDNALAKKYSDADNYFEVATAALKEMHRQVGTYKIENKIIKKGIIIRHLALPNHRDDSIKILELIADIFPENSVLISLMSQYTPAYKSNEFKEISRKISSFEYSRICEKAIELGLEGYTQERCSAINDYTPDFDLSGL